jgi:hypothetical protein
MTPQDGTQPKETPLDPEALQQQIIEEGEAAPDTETPTEDAAETPAPADAPPAPEETPPAPAEPAQPAEDNSPPAEEAPAPFVPPIDPSGIISERDKVLRTIQKAHEEWIGENAKNEPKSTQPGQDANQFAMDTDMPQEGLLDKIEQNKATTGADPLESAIDRLQNLIKSEGLDSSVEVRRKGE